MTSIEQISEQAIRIIAGGDRNIDDFEIDIREVQLLVAQTANYFIKQNLFQNIAQGQHNVGGEYVASFKNIDILFDTDTDLAYIDLPAKYISLPYDRGIHQISLMKDQFNVFIPIRNGAMAIFKNSPAGRLEGRIGYWPEQGRVYFTTDISTKIDKCLVKQIITGADGVLVQTQFIAPDVELPILEKVIGLLRMRLPQDKQNNNIEVL